MRARLWLDVELADGATPAAVAGALADLVADIVTGDEHNANEELAKIASADDYGGVPLA